MTENCAICLSALNNRREKKAYQSCPSCGTCYVKNMPKRQKIIRGLNTWAKGVIRKEAVCSIPATIIYQRINRLKKSYLVGNRLLDAGCGKPDFLLAAKNAGFIVSGMDITKPIIQELIENAIPAYTSFSDIKNAAFDIVTNFDVIEHTTNPVDFIREIGRVTKKKGILFLSTPNATSISARILGESWWVFGPDGHYILFTPKSIRMLLKDNGYSIVTVETNTLTQWLHTRSQLVNTIGNKIVYCLLFPFLPVLFRLGFGDNIEVVAQKIR